MPDEPIEVDFARLHRLSIELMIREAYGYVLDDAAIRLIRKKRAAAGRPAPKRHEAQARWVGHGAFQSPPAVRPVHDSVSEKAIRRTHRSGTYRPRSRG